MFTWVHKWTVAMLQPLVLTEWWAAGAKDKVKLGHGKKFPTMQLLTVIPGDTE